MTTKQKIFPLIVIIISNFITISVFILWGIFLYKDYIEKKHQEEEKYLIHLTSDGLVCEPIVYTEIILEDKSNESFFTYPHPREDYPDCKVIVYDSGVNDWSIDCGSFLD